MRNFWPQSTEEFGAKWFWYISLWIGMICMIFFIGMVVWKYNAIRSGFQQARAWQKIDSDGIAIGNGSLGIYLYAPQTVGHYSTDKVIVGLENTSDQALAGVRVNIGGASKGDLQFGEKNYVDLAIVPPHSIRNEVITFTVASGLTQISPYTIPIGACVEYQILSSPTLTYTQWVTYTETTNAADGIATVVTSSVSSITPSQIYTTTISSISRPAEAPSDIITSTLITSTSSVIPTVTPINTTITTTQTANIPFVAYPRVACQPLNPPLKIAVSPYRDISDSLIIFVNTIQNQLPRVVEIVTALGALIASVLVVRGGLATLFRPSSEMDK